jgi:hypothetical protein
MSAIGSEDTKLVAILGGVLIAVLVGAVAFRAQRDAQDRGRGLLAFLVPMLGCLVIDAYATFFQPGLAYEPIVAVGILLVMVFWSVPTTERFVAPGRSIIVAGSGPAHTGLRALFLTELALVSFIVLVYILREIAPFDSSGIDPGSLQSLLTLALGFILFVTSLQLGKVDQSTPDEPQLVSRQAMYFIFMSLSFLGLGSSYAFGFLASAVPARILDLAIEFRFLLMAGGAVLVVFDAGRLFARALPAIFERVDKAATLWKVPDNILILLVAGTVQTLLRIALLVLLCLLNFTKQLFVATFRAVVTAASFIVLHLAAVVAVIAALLYVPRAFAGIEHYLSDGSMALVPVATVAGFLILTGAVAIADFVTAHLALPKLTPDGRSFPVIAFTLAGIWLSSVIVHLVKAVTGIGPAVFAFPHFGLTFFGGFFVLALGIFLLRRAPTKGTPRRNAI